MRAQVFFNDPNDPISGDAGTTTPTETTDDPGRPDADTVPKKKAE